MKRILFFLRREKNKEEKKKEGQRVGSWEKKKRVWSCQWTPQFSTYLQKDHSATLLEK